MTATVPPVLSLDVALQQAVAHHQAGRLREAEQLYRAILQAQPGQPDANHNLGVLAGQVGQRAAGLPYLKTALALNPSHGQYALSYADALLATGQAREALNILRSAMQRGLNTTAARLLRQKAEAAVLNNPAPTPSELDQLVAQFNAGHFAEVESRARLLVEQYPASGPSWNLLGVSLQVQGKEGLPAMQKAAELLPDDAVTHSNLGNVLRDLGQLDGAVASYRRALEIKPDLAGVHSNLGNALQTLGQLDDAAASYRRALAINPDYAEAHNNLGNALRALGQLDDAAASYRRALEINPDYAEAHNNLSAALNGLKQFENSVKSARRALEIKPNFAEAHSNLGNALQAIGQFDDAAASYRRALEIKPNFAMAHINLGTVLKVQGHLGDAKACYSRAHQLGLYGARIKEALMLPAIMGTKQEMLDNRAEFERNLDKLIADRVMLDDPLGSVRDTNFFLAYHGLNDRDLQIKIAKYYGQACPSLLYTAPHCFKLKPNSQKKIQVGFLSKFLYEHSVSRCFSKIVEKLSLNGHFDVTLISSHPIDEEIYPCFSGKSVRMPENLALAREKVAALKLDILVYLDIGMDPLSYFMAFSRLAPVQCVMGGHPVTTGIGNMDYFLSGDLMEPAGADEHYSEKLVRLPKGGAFYFERPALPTTFKTRSELGLPEGRHIYMCPMKLQKMHPDFDEAISRILQIDDNGVVVLFEDNRIPQMKTMLAKRFEKTIPENVRERIIFLPWIKEYKDFISANAAADVVLDPFHFGIGSTIIATFAAGTPIVTKPGEFLRGRVGMGFCMMMDTPECIAEDTEAYAQKAVQIARNRPLRDTISAKILKNNHILYEDLQPVDDLADFFRSLNRSTRETTITTP